jgi:hypothetical protein
VRQYDSSYTGTYQIGFNTSFVPPVVIELTENQWADGNIPRYGQQWFTFTATASTQYIHVAFGTLSSYYGMYVQVYDSSGTTVGSETRLTSSTRNISRSLTANQTYYIRVRQYDSSYTGTYQIGFNTSTIAPTS